MLSAELKDLYAQLQKATDMRLKEKEENAMSLKDSKEGLAAIKKAIGILKDFYAKGAKAALLQASPVDEDAPESPFEGSYKGKQGASKGVIGMLEVIESDFERAIKQTELGEKEAARVYVNFDRQIKTSVSSKETGKEQAEADLKMTEIAIQTGMRDLETTQKMLDDSLKELENLKPACIDTGMSYKERVAAREGEIEAL